MLRGFVECLNSEVFCDFGAVMLNDPAASGRVHTCSQREINILDIWPSDCYQASQGLLQYTSTSYSIQSSIGQLGLFHIAADAVRCRTVQRSAVTTADTV